MNKESGTLYFKGRLENGYRQGRGTEYDESGNVTFDGFYDKGTKLENVVPLEEMKGYWKEYNADHKLISITQRDDLGRKEGICYFYNGEEKIDRISEWKEDKEISTSGYCDIYDEPRKVWYKGYFDNGKQVYTVPLEERKGYWKESDEDNKLVSICGKDKEGKYNGVCYFYSNDKISQIKYYEHGEEKRVIKEFNGSTMIEYDENKQKLYEGEYLESFELDYPRHGKGTSYKNNEVNKKTTWLTGYTKQGLLLTFLAIIVVLIILFVIDVFLGLAATVIVDLLIIIRWSCPKVLGKKLCNKTDLQLMADYKKTKSSQGADVEKGKESSSTNCFYRNIYLSITVILTLIIIVILICAHFYYSLANPYVSVFQTSYKVGPDRMNKVSGFKLSNRALLKSIEIGTGCFEVASVFQVKGLSSLQSVKIGSNSFTQARNNFGNDGSKSFHILNCKNLQSIEIGEYSFSDFGGDFEIKNLPALQSLEIGGVSSPSLNFYSVKSILIEDLPSLNSVSFGDSAFYDFQSAVFSNLPLLNSISLGQSAFSGKQDVSCSLVMEDLPKLASISSVGSSFYYPRNVTLSNIPNLESVTLPDSFGYYFYLSVNNVNELLTQLVPSGVYHVDDLYESVDVVPQDAQKIVFKANSFGSVETLSIQNYPNLTSLVFEANVFNNANAVEISGAKLQEVVIGDNCFAKSETEAEAEAEGTRRLVEANSIELTLPRAERLSIGSKSLLNANTLVFYELSDDVAFELGSGSMMNVNRMEYSYGISVDRIINMKLSIKSNGGGAPIENETINTSLCFFLYLFL